MTQVEPYSAAVQAGLQPGDLIVAMNGRSIAGYTKLRSQIGLKRIGSDVELQVVRDGKTLSLSGTLKEENRSLPHRVTARLAGCPAADMRELQPGDPLYRDLSGAVIPRLDPGNRAAPSGLEAGDIILAVSRAPVASMTNCGSSSRVNM